MEYHKEKGFGPTQNQFPTTVLFMPGGGRHTCAFYTKCVIGFHMAYRFLSESADSSLSDTLITIIGSHFRDSKTTDANGVVRYVGLPPGKHPNVHGPS